MTLFLYKCFVICQNTNKRVQRRHCLCYPWSTVFQWEWKSSVHFKYTYFLPGMRRKLTHRPRMVGFGCWGWGHPVSITRGAQCLGLELPWNPVESLISICKFNKHIQSSRKKKKSVFCWVCMKKKTKNKNSHNCHALV